jgi:hypothetical protein
MTHPITPPPKLVQQWINEHFGNTSCNPFPCEVEFAARAAQWGADQELESCRIWVDYKCSSSTARQLQEDRRPKPPSLKEQALEALGANGYSMLSGKRLEPIQLEIIRRALEELP